MATDYLNALGVGAGLDTVALVSAIVDAEIAPKQSSIETRLADAEVKISGMASLKSAMQTLQSAYETLNDAREFDFSYLSNTNPSAVSVIANGEDTQVGSQSIVVHQLAQGDIRVSNTVADKTADLGAGGETFTFTVAGEQTSISLNAGDSLEDLAAAINDSSAAVNARIVEVEAGSYRLFIQSDATGDANAITIDSDITALQLGLDANHAQQSQNAELSFNGVAVSRSSNLVNDLVPGLTLNLLQAGDAETTLEIGRDDGAAATAVHDLVDAFNAFNTVLSGLLTVANENGEAGAFAGDPTVRNIMNRAKELFFAEGSVPGANIKRMSDLGVSVDRNGLFQVDDTKLNSALANHYDEVKSFFTAGIDDQSDYSVAPRGFAGDLIKQMDEYLGFGGLVSSRESANTKLVASLTDDQSELDIKRATLEARYTKQFTTMNQIVSEMNSLKDYLDSQLKNLPFTAKNN
jgi:flagellar hook-associated protein 2